MNKGKKILGFVIILSIIVIILQVSSIITKKIQQSEKTVVSKHGVKFMPETLHNKEPEIKKTNTDNKKPEITEITKIPKRPEKNSPEIKKEEPLKSFEQLPQPKSTLKQNDSQNIESKTEVKQKLNKDIHHNERAKKEDNTYKEMIKTPLDSKTDIGESKIIKGSNKKAVENVSMTNKDFISLDLTRDMIIEEFVSSGKEIKGKYGWGILSDYENPDLAHRLLGGIPFAIYEAGKEYYRIYLEENRVQPAIALSAYGTTGIAAYDNKLRLLVVQAVKKGHVTTSPNLLKYYYLFSVNTEIYIRAKVVKAFEWYISKLNYNASSANSFRQEARLRIGVWKASRPDNGEMGVAIPIYFDYQNKKLFLPDDYYKEDQEALKLNVSIDQSKY